MLRLCVEMDTSFRWYDKQVEFGGQASTLEIDGGRVLTFQHLEVLRRYTPQAVIPAKAGIQL